MGRYRKPFSLYKRGDYWYYRTYDSDGYRTAGKSTGLTRKSDAMAYCYEIMHTDKLGITRLSFAQYTKGFFDENSIYWKDRTRAPSVHTVRTYKDNYMHYILPFFSDFQIAEITFSDVRRFRQSLIDRNLKPATINLIITTLKVITVTAYRDGKIKQDPCSFIKKLKTESTRDRFKREEIRELVRLLNGPEKNFILLLSITGMRRAECLGVIPTDVKEDENIKYINLIHQIIKKKYAPLKTKDSRIIPIPEEALSFICGFNDVSFRKIDNAIKELHLPEERGLCLHSLRHFFCTEPKTMGVNPLIVERIAGHSLPGMTDVYTNLHVRDLTDILLWQKELIEYLLT